jgi:hypothetical protein
LQVHDITARLAATIASADPMAAAREVMEVLGRDLSGVARALAYIPGTWATILVLSGEERNTLYRQDDDGGLRRASEVELTSGSILPMRASTVHVAECLGTEPALGLHVYGADVLSTARHMWDPETLQRHPLEWTRYETFAQRASKMSAAP